MPNNKTRVNEAEDTDLQAWDEFQAGLDASFLQGGGWSVFNRRLGRDVSLLQGKDWTALCIERSTPFGNYWLLPYGPTCKNQSSLSTALRTIKHEAKIRKLKWVRFEPICTDKNVQLIPKEAKRAVREVEPAQTLVLDLEQDEAWLRARIGSTNRNLINRAQKAGVICKRSNDPKDIEYFIGMLKKLEQRNNVSFHEDEYYRMQAKTLLPRGDMQLHIAYVAGKPVAVVIMHPYHNTISYTYAASLYEARDTNASIALTWHCITEAKRSGFKTFDFNGIAPEGASDNHPWHGFTKYKLKFGGEKRYFSGTWDMRVSPIYYPYILVYKMRKLLR